MVGRIEGSYDDFVILHPVCIDWVEGDFSISCNINSYWPDGAVSFPANATDGGCSAHKQAVALQDCFYPINSLSSVKLYNPGDAPKLFLKQVNKPCLVKFLNSRLPVTSLIFVCFMKVVELNSTF